MNALTEPWQIALYRMKALSKALELETLGMKKRGRSAYSIVKEEYGLKGNKMTVLEKLNALYEDEKEIWK
jgi:hypothetical protein